MASSRAGEELAGRQVEEGRERLEGLERELRDVRREAAALKGQLAATEEVNPFSLRPMKVSCLWRCPDIYVVCRFQVSLNTVYVIHCVTCHVIITCIVTCHVIITCIVTCHVIITCSHMIIFDIVLD